MYLFLFTVLAKCFAQIQSQRANENICSSNVSSCHVSCSREIRTLLQLATKVSLHESRGDKWEGMGLGSPCPGSVGLHWQETTYCCTSRAWLCGDSIRNKFSHPGLQTIGTGLKMGISKQLQHCMNGGSVIIRN